MAHINWKNRISKDDKYIDTTGLPYYKLSFEKGITEKIYEIDVNIPDPPPDEMCVNYGLSEHDQIFRRTYVPDQIRYPDKNVGRTAFSQREIDSFIDQQWNIRTNGIWFFIKGKKTYIPGQLWFKYNVWVSSTNEEFEYREHERQFFTYMLHLQRDPIDLGVADFKCRQLGDTENALCIMYERGSRIRGSLTTMQSCINEDHIYAAYNRLTHAHKNMIYYFRPVNTGTENPRKGLIFDYPSKYMTHASMTKNNESGGVVNKSSLEDYQYPPVGSSFRYGPSKVKHFDGATGVITAYNDEYGKCFGGETRFLMYDGSYKRADKILVGDVIMGDDGEARVVEKVYQGHGELYRVSPRARTFESYVVTGDHTLVMKWARSSNIYGWAKDEIVEMSVQEFLQSSSNVQKHMTLFKTGVDYETKPVTIDPYFLGVWLGDGSHNGTHVTNMDLEVQEYLKKYSEELGLIHRVTGDISNENSITSGTGPGREKNANTLLNELRALRLIGNKHIPTDYLINDRDTRLNVLAGLIDTDGYREQNERCYEITQKRRNLSIQIHKLVTELGFKSSINTKIATMKRDDGTIYRRKVYRISIFGKDLHEIPCRVSRKIIAKRTHFHKNTRDSKKTTFTVSKEGVGKYYGFVTNGNNRVLLRDCQVVHNSETMDPTEWIQTMVETVFSNIRGKKRGILIMTSTIEDMTENSLEWAMQIWKESDPKKRSATGSTTNRIVRIFRGVACRGFETIVADRWGFIDEEAVIAAVTDKYNAFIEAGNVKGAMSFLRKNPRTIEDVFLSVRNQSSFNTAGLAEREFKITETMSPKPWVRGNLKWKDGQRDTQVVWEPNPNGLWEISAHPSDFGFNANEKSARTFSRSPGNTEYFCAGVDPVDQSKTLESDEKRSKIGIAVMRRLDMNVDSDKNLYHQKDDDINGISAGDPIMGGEMHKTNRFVCVYKHRHPDVFDDFENIILTMVYFGTDFLPEDNKAGALKPYLRNRGYENYITNKPSISANHKGQHQKGGVSGSEKTFNECFSFIETYTYKWYNAIDHPMLLSDWITMNWSNRGEKDLGVAAGWCLYHSHMSPKRKMKTENKKKAVHFHMNRV